MMVQVIDWTHCTQRGTLARLLERADVLLVYGRRKGEAIQVMETPDGNQGRASWALYPLVLSILSWATGESDPPLCIDRSRGKPILVSHPGLHFNVSRSGAWYVVALSHNPVGVDVEKIIDDPHNWLVQRYLFHALERAALAAVPPQLWTEQFYRTWTRKEAVVKCNGLGMMADFTGFSVLSETPQCDDRHMRSAFSNISCWSLPPLEEIQISCAVRQG